MGQFTAAEKMREAEREVQMRWRVYGRGGNFTPDQRRRIDLMKEIAEDYRKLAETEKGSLI